MSVSPMKLAAIQVGGRHRRDLGDVAGLAASIADVGLLHPIVVNTAGELIAGERRLEAAKLLGWKEVPANIIDLDAIVKGEFAENAHRKDFLPSEIDAIRRALEPIERAAAKARMSEGAKGSENFATLPGKASDKIGAFAGVSGRTIEKIARVVEAAKTEPEQFGHLVDEMDRSGRGVDRAYRALRRARDERRVVNLQPQEGRFRTLILDPPWPLESVGAANIAARGHPQYALMTAEQILALPVPSWAEDNCHLYLWATNSNLPLACKCVEAWGFKYKTALTWVKPRFGLGAYFRGSTEHVLFGVRGELMTRATSIATHFEAPVGEHSEKPEKFYEIVRAASFPPYGEAFQRKVRNDFTGLYEAAAAAAE